MKSLGTIILCLSIAFSTSCKKNASSQTNTPKDTIAYDTAFHQAAVIQYTDGVSLSALWEDNRSMTETTIMHALCTEEGNPFVMAEVKEKYHFQHFYVLGLDIQGITLGDARIKEPNDVKYQFYDSFLIPQKTGFPVYYILGVNSKKGVYAPEGNKDPEIAVSSLDRYSIDKLIFGNDIGNYQTRSISLKHLLKDFVIKDQISRFVVIKLRRYDGRIFLYGDVGIINGEWWGTPFIVTLSDDLKVLDSKVYSQDRYKDTYIESIEIDKDNNITLKGEKHDAADGYYYHTRMQFVVDKNLNFLKDQSDEEPYYSYYRGPSAPDYTDDGEDEEAGDVEIEENDEDEEQVEVAEETTSSILTRSTDEKTEKFFHSGDYSRKTYYSLSYIEDKSYESDGTENNSVLDVTLKKMNRADSTLILKRTFLLGKDYSPKMVYETPDGGFVMAFSWRHKVSSEEDYRKDAYQSKVLLFRFNKEGNLSHQYETPLYTGTVTDLYLSGTKDKLIMTFMTSNSYFYKNEWRYPEQLSIMAFPL